MTNDQLNRGTQFIIKNAYDWAPVMNGALRTGLIGAGVGGAVQLGRRMFAGPNEEKPSILKGMLYGGLGGAGLGAGMGAGVNYLKGQMDGQTSSTPSNNYNTPSLANSMDGDVARMTYGDKPESVWNAKYNELGKPPGPGYSPGSIDVGATNRAYRDFNTMAAGGGIGQSMDQSILTNGPAMHDASIRLDDMTTRNIMRAMGGVRSINIGQQQRLGDTAANWKL